MLEWVMIWYCGEIIIDNNVLNIEMIWVIWKFEYLWNM